MAKLTVGWIFFDFLVDFLDAWVFAAGEGYFGDGYALGGGFVAFVAQCLNDCGIVFP